ncbi:MAG: hypothetical protein H6811_10610 [Phycisphaeraceae bacterium]|nr:hypothetical protein [Phycisphaeraceae bacterium]
MPMTQHQYEAERIALAKKADRLRAEAKRIMEDVDALDRLWERHWKQQPAAVAPSAASANGEASPPVERGELAAAVRAYVAQSSARFTSQDVKRHLVNEPALAGADISAIGKTLRRMLADSMVVQVTPAHGKTPATYRKPEPGGR